MELYTSTVIDESVGGMCDREHVLVMKESRLAQFLSQIDLE